METWLSGVSDAPLPLFETKLRFLVAPAASWTVKEVWVCGSTTSADAKHYLQEHRSRSLGTKSCWRAPRRIGPPRKTESSFQAVPGLIFFMLVLGVFGMVDLQYVDVIMKGITLDAVGVVVSCMCMSGRS